MARQELIVLGRCDGVDEIVGIGAEVEGVEVGRVDLDRSPTLAVGLHDLDRVVRRLDARNRVIAALSADGLRVTVATGDGGGAGPDERVRGVLGTDEFGEERLPHGPPLETRVEGCLGRFEVFPDGQPIVPVAERGIETPQTLEPGFERGLGPTRRFVPRLEIVEDGADLDQRVELGIGQIEFGGFGGVADQEGREVDSENVVALVRPPKRGVGEQLGPEIAHGVAKSAADPRRVVVLLDVPSQHADALVAPGPASRPKLTKGAVGLLDDLIDIPLLEVELTGGFHPLALADLPRVGVDIRGEGVGVGEIEHRSRNLVLGPRRLPAESAPRFHSRAGRCAV